jgi:hypothetical protein
MDPGQLKTLYECPTGPPHCSHWLQPLDVGGMGPYKGTGRNFTCRHNVIIIYWKQKEEGK